MVELVADLPVTEDPSRVTKAAPVRITTAATVTQPVRDGWAARCRGLCPIFLGGLTGGASHTRCGFRTGRARSEGFG